MITIKKILFSLCFVACVAVLMPSCSDDDMSQDEMMKELIENGTDRIMDGLYGNVKSVEEIEYDDAEWVNNTVSKGSPSYKTIVTYNSDGYYSGEKYYNNGDAKLRIRYEWEVTSFDNKSRGTEEVRKDYYYNDSQTTTPSSTEYEKSTFVYDDKAKTVTVTYAISSNGTTYEQTDEKVVYDLLPNGRLDKENYKRYIIKSATEKAATEDVLVKSQEVIKKLDAQENWVLSYSKKYDKDSSDQIEIDYYSERTIVYY